MPLNSKHLIPLGFAVLHVLVCLLLFPQMKYCFDADFFSYHAVAEKWASGDFYHAINPYWSPFFSWIMVPFMWMGLPVYFVFKWIFVAFGIGSILLFHKLLLEQEVPVAARVAGTGALTAFCIYFSLYYAMPDIMVVFFYLLYFSWHKGLFKEKRTAIITGLIGGFCFFVKAYSLPFLVLYSTVLIGAKWIIDRDLSRPEIKNFGIYLITLLVVSSCWIIPLSWKYGGPTMGRSGKFNYHMKMSKPHQKQLSYPYEAGLLPPPNPTAVSYWEDPSTMNGWLEDQSKSNWGIQILITAQNIFACGRTLQYYNPFFFFIAIILAILLLKALLESAMVFKREVITATLFAGVYPSGYFLLFINERYHWVLFTFLLYVCVLLFSKVIKTFNLNTWQQLVTAIGFFLVTAYAPVDRTQVVYRRLAPTYEADYKKALEIKEIIPHKAKMAYDEDWGKGKVTAFMNNNRFYGIFSKNQTTEQLVSKIYSYQLEYLVLYSDEVKTDLAPYIELVSPAQFRPGVYKVKHIK